MKHHRELLLGELKPLGVRAEALFCLSAAERLRACCWAFEKQTSHGLESYFRWSNALFAALKEESWSSLPLNEAHRELDAAVPRSDDYGSPLSIQAQSALICLVVGVEVLLGTNPRAVVDASNAVVDALDNYVFQVHQQLAGDMPVPDEYLLLSREIDRQLHDLRLLKGIGEIEERGLVAWRLENQQFAVPIAF